MKTWTNYVVDITDGEDTSCLIINSETFPNREKALEEARKICLEDTDNTWICTGNVLPNRDFDKLT